MAINILKRFLLLALILLPLDIYAQVVKKSSSGLCHDERSPHYERTTNFKPFNTLDACLDSGGRLPANLKKIRPKTDSYSRNAFRHWIDENKNCLNTRHELLNSQSTGNVTFSEDGCRVVRGRWNDPYSGQIFFEGNQVDVDHIVPLAWAWEHGASEWNDEKREHFANDERNLLIVSASLNRSKGAKGPRDWMPPNEQYHCQYATRYLRILMLYGFNDSIKSDIKDLRAHVCKN